MDRAPLGGAGRRALLLPAALCGGTARFSLFLLLTTLADLCSADGPPPAPPCCVGGYDWTYGYIRDFSDVDVNVTFLDDQQLAAVQRAIAAGDGSALTVYSDLSFYIQLDNSYQFATHVQWLNITSNEVNTFSFDQDYNANFLSIAISSSDPKQLRCSLGGNPICINHDPDELCCQGLPKDEYTDALLVSARMRPRHGYAQGDAWARNKFSLQGSHYTVSLPSDSCGAATRAPCPWPPSLPPLPLPPTPRVGAYCGDSTCGAALLSSGWKVLSEWASSMVVPRRRPAAARAGRATTRRRG